MHNQLGTNYDEKNHQILAILDSSSCLRKNEEMVQFYDWVSKKQILNLESIPVAKKLFRETRWMLDHGQFNVVSEASLFGLVAEVKIQKLSLCRNKRPNIIRDIKQVSFPLLTKLLLNDNHIISLEFLDKIYCPNLEALTLINNKITHIRSFKKTKFPNLHYLSLQKNHIQDLSGLALAPTQNFNQLMIETDHKDTVLSNDISWVGKVSALEIKQIWIESSGRIQNQKHYLMLMKKFQQLSFLAKSQAINTY